MFESQCPPPVPIQAKEFKMQMNSACSKIIRLNGDAGPATCFAFKQSTKFGPLQDISKASAVAAAKRWEKGPGYAITWEDFKLMGSIVFTTADVCFPCWAWGNNGGCFHQHVVREKLGLPSLTNPMERKLGRSKGRGRKRRARARHFVANVHR